MRLFYTLGVRLYAFGIRVAALWNKKARLWTKGRKNWKKNIPEFRNEDDTYWFHCASLGEFEQGLPIMEALKSKGKKIVVSFFSPSGYENKKNHPIAEHIFYLPIDTAKNASVLLDKIQPQAIIFVKYEFWGNLILEAKKRNIQLSLVCGLFRPNQIFFKWYGGLMREILKSFNHVFVQTEDSSKLLKTIHVQSEVFKDTRFDRVTKNLSEKKSFPKIEKFILDKKVLVLGSVWEQDLKVISNSVKNLGEDWCIIIAPHNIDKTSVKNTADFFESPIIYSTFDNSPSSSRFLIMDTMGMLQHVYRYGNIAYVGGGFKTGLHNILEPAVFGLPVIFGDNTDKFPEAATFIKNGIGFSISDEQEFTAVFNRLSEQDIKAKVQGFVAENIGVSAKIAALL